MLVVAVANQKGGVGKSTTTVHLARALQLQRQRVLVCDLDPQGNSSSALVQEPLEKDAEGVVTQATMGDVLVPTARFQMPMTDIIVPSIYGDGVDVAPGAAVLSAVEEMLVGKPDRETALRRALEPVVAGGAYDVMLIDCEPSLGLLTVNALVASTGVLIVAEAQLWSTDGMGELRRTIRLVQGRHNAALGYLGVVISKWETVAGRPTNRGKQALADIRQYFPEAEVLEPFIPLRAHVGEAVEEGIPLDQWRKGQTRTKESPMQEIAKGYAKHATAILERGKELGR